ncbi:hypothetical protein ACP179_01920 (plasmid) [Xenorhabdus stockiae]|uniref:hypothetical protein n=1 Tax=Xenorhabdus stockiae TaxID=351614 RepID=UPI003CE9B2D8
MMNDDLDFYIEERTRENHLFKTILAEVENELGLEIEMQSMLTECRKNTGPSSD